MCGIIGYVGSLDSCLRDRMVAAVRHRGPDGCGSISRKNVHLGTTRLSVIDPGAGSNLASNEAGDIVLAFNGEIYNHRELRSLLSARGHIFKTQTDTEVIVHLYEQFGTGCLNYLRGMFAFALFDGKRLFLARDRLGIKPLYYCYMPNSGMLIFASEIKAILECEDYIPELDRDTFADFVVMGHGLGTATLFRGVVSLAPGCWLNVHISDEVTLDGPHAYFVQPDRQATIDFVSAQQRLSQLIDNAVLTHFDADVEVGLTLSGGLDSTLLACVRKQQSGLPFQTFTIADSEDHPDMILARDIARNIGARHHPYILSFGAYLGFIGQVITAEESPSSLWALPFLGLSKLVSGHVKVCVHGEGADEIFGGYREYLDRDAKLAQYRKRLPLLTRLGIKPSPKLVRCIKAVSSRHSDDVYLNNVFRLNLADQLERFHLEPVDRYAMSVGVEMRVPYLDDDVVDFVSRLPTDFLVRMDLGIQKYILRHIAAQRFGLNILDVILRRKLGAPASGAALHRRFDELCEEILPADYLEKHELGFCFRKKRDLLMFDLFHESFIQNRGRERSLNIIDALAARAPSPRKCADLNGYRTMMFEGASVSGFS